MVALPWFYHFCIFSQDMEDPAFVDPKILVGRLGVSAGYLRIFLNTRENHYDRPLEIMVRLRGIIPKWPNYSG